PVVSSLTGLLNRQTPSHKHVGLAGQNIRLRCLRVRHKLDINLINLRAAEDIRIVREQNGVTRTRELLQLEGSSPNVVVAPVGEVDEVSLVTDIWLFEQVLREGEEDRRSIKVAVEERIGLDVRLAPGHGHRMRVGSLDLLHQLI